YDPANGSWSPVANLAGARMLHTATLLPDGKVLVAGGTYTVDSGDIGDQLSSAEPFDPGTGTWGGTASLNTARAFHTSTLLRDGTVLITGGTGVAGSIISAEL